MNLKEQVMLIRSHIMGVLAQEEKHHNPEKIVNPEMPELLRSAAAQGAVLLENRVLPLSKGSKVSVFGRVQKDYFFTGYGSGGDVNFPYSVSLLEGLRSCEDLQVNESLAGVYEAWLQEHPADHGVWGNWPRFHPEMPVTQKLAAQARAESDHAVIVIGRSSGEDRENALEPGSFYLTDEERNMLKTVTEAFPDAVLVMNIGAVIDFSFIKEYSFGAVLIAWQGGMESGNAVADILCGKVCPSGRLTATVANTYDAYPSAKHFGDPDVTEYWEDIYVGYRWFETFRPEDVLYPFGHGLSYTRFQVDVQQTDSLTFQATVTNTGSCSGKETVMLFVSKPQAPLGNPSRELLAFKKTRELAPGEQETLTLTATRYQLSSYDDTGVTGHKSCYVLQQGTYRFYVGCDVRSAALQAEHLQEEAVVMKRHQEVCAPAKSFKILSGAFQDGNFVPTEINSPVKTVNLKKTIWKNLPKSVPMTGDLGFKLKDVKDGKVSLDDFVGQLNLTELEAISRGAYSMNSPLGPRGNAGVFGGVTESLRKKGVPPITTTDGPSGIRLYDSCSLIPIGTLLACSFDASLVQSLFAAVGREMKQRGTDVLLAPGMNLQRSPLCGRNFEYYSEDPCVSGKIAVAAVRGLQSEGVSACPKHFPC